MHEVLEGAIHGESRSPTRGGAGEPWQLGKSFVEPSIWLLKVENARQSDGSGDRRDAKELAGPGKEQVEAGCIDLPDARTAVFVHRAQERYMILVRPDDAVP